MITQLFSIEFERGPHDGLHVIDFSRPQRSICMSPTSDGCEAATAGLAAQYELLGDLDMEDLDLEDLDLEDLGLADVDDAADRETPIVCLCYRFVGYRSESSSSGTKPGADRAQGASRWQALADWSAASRRRVVAWMLEPVEYPLKTTCAN